MSRRLCCCSRGDITHSALCPTGQVEEASSSDSVAPVAKRPKPDILAPTPSPAPSLMMMPGMVPGFPPMMMPGMVPGIMPGMIPAGKLTLILGCCPPSNTVLCSLLLVPGGVGVGVGTAGPGYVLILHCSVYTY